MSNNCLVTKLKGSVQNDNLPRFNQSILDYYGIKNLSDSITLMIMVDSSAENPTIMTSPVDMRLNTSSGELVREVTVNPGSFQTVYFNSGESVGANPISDLLSINGIYDLCKLQINKGFDWRKAKASLDSILQYGKVYAFGLCIEDPNNPTNNYTIPEFYPSDLIEYMYVKIESEANTTFVNLSRLSNLSSLKVIYGDSPSEFSRSFIRMIPEGVQYVGGFRYLGNINTWPISLRGISPSICSTTQCTGSLESFVEKARQGGRTSGYLLISSGVNTSTRITFDNQNFYEYKQTHTIPSVKVGTGNYNVLTWDANTISWGDTAPVDALDITYMPSVYRYNKQS